MADLEEVEQMRNSLVGAATMVAVAGAAGITYAPMAFPPLAAADSNFFLSPSHNISCQITPDETFCLTFSPPQSVHMEPSGGFSTCTGDSCMSNPPVGTPTLSCGQTMGTGPFTCLSEVSGATCTVASGRGFKTSSSGITRVG